MPVIIQRDQAIQNAEARMDKIREEARTLSKEIERIQEQRNALQAEFEHLANFRRTWYEIAGIKPHTPEKQVRPMRVIEAQDPTDKRPLNPDRRFVADKVVEILRNEGRPLSRKELFDRLSKVGVEIQGKDPLMVLSTMLWRSKSKVRRLKSGGYWPTNDEVRPEHTDDIEDLIG
jgi:FtsZ-binding cell division protein ZapB